MSGPLGKYKENMFLVEDSEAKAAGDGIRTTSRSSR